jgi:hypothetical protein
MNKKNNSEIVAKNADVLTAEQTVATPVASATVSLTKKQSVIKGFNYTKDYVRLVFMNGDSAILGSKDSGTISTALQLKGQSVDYRLGALIPTEFGGYHKVLIDCIY